MIVVRTCVRKSVRLTYACSVQIVLSYLRSQKTFSLVLTISTVPVRYGTGTANTSVDKLLRRTVPQSPMDKRKN